MTPDEIEIALAPFQQVENPLTRKNEGTGLGPSLANALVELRQGLFSLESEPGGATPATVHFPAERVITDVSAAAGTQSSPSRSQAFATAGE